MKYNWVKGYKYQNIPLFYKSIDIFGFNLSIRSNKTKRKRVGLKMTSDEDFSKYLGLVESLYKK